MQASYDAVVIGAGHNGLVAAAYLAKAGRRVLVLERRSVVGGAAATEEFYPGFRGPTGATLCGLLRPEVMRDLQLAAHGLQFLPCDPEVVTLGDDGTALRLWNDPAKSQAEISTRSTRDAEAYPRFTSFLTRLAAIADPVLASTPPDVDGLGIVDELFLLRRAWTARKLGKEGIGQAVRMVPMSVRSVLNEWFETELLRATLAMDALIGVGRGPWSPGTAFGLLHHFLPRARGTAWSFVRGGMGNLSRALASSAQAAGVTIRTDAAVERILTSDGRVSGVQFATGETIPARIVLSNADPKRTFLQLVDPAELGLEFTSQVRNIQMDGSVAKVNFALNAAPAIPMQGDGGLVAPHFRIGPSLEYLERAYDDAKYGAPSEHPFLDVVIPTVVDPDLAPAGKHVMSVLVQYAPYRLKKGNWDDRREKLGEVVVDLLDGHIPGFRKLVLGQEVLTPVDLERRFGMTGGHIYHGEMTLNQQFVLRPVPGWSQYRTPIEGLYLCGSGAHPGGGITGAPGYNSAREVLRNRAPR